MAFRTRALFDAARLVKIPLILLVIYHFFYCDVEAALLKTIASNDLESVSRANEHLLVVFVSKECTSCKVAELQLSLLASRDNLDLQVTVVRIVDSEIPSKLYGHSSKKEPLIVFYRHRNPLLYDGKFETSAIDEWITYNHESALKILSDDDFEHLTQAGTGATTGDWLVIFCDVTERTCLQYQHVYEAVAAKLKARHNVAFVDSSKNSRLVQRFSIVGPINIIFFRLGKMYEYPIDKIDVVSLSAFAVNFYKNAKSSNVPNEPSPFDQLTGRIAASLEENRSYLFIFMVLAIFVPVAVIYLILRRSGRKSSEVSKKK